jgi:hypothetical protein
MGGDYFAALSLAKSGLNAAWEIAKALRSAETQIKTAELKLQLADMMVALAEAKANLAEVHEQLADNLSELDRLEEALRNKDQVRKQHDAYYAADAQGNLSGDPYCMRCWEAEHKLHHLRMGRGTNTCAVCQASFMAHISSPIGASVVDPLTRPLS